MNVSFDRRANTPILVLIGTLTLAQAACESASGTADDDAPAIGSMPEQGAPPAVHPTPAAEGGIAWFHDDYAGALAAAKKTGKPLVADLWAPWCHTCLSMKKFVLTDEKITKSASDFVWLSVDTDKPANVAAMKKMPISSWPTFYVLDANDEHVLSRHVGSASVEQFEAFLNAARPGAGDDAATAALLEGDGAAGRGDRPAAAMAYAKALDTGGPDWPRRFSTRVSLVENFYRMKQWEACVDIGLVSLDDMKKARSASAADFTYFVLACSDHVPAEKRDAVRAKIAAKDNAIRAVLDDATADLTVDDRSDALRILRDIEGKLGSKDEAKRLARMQQKVLDDAVKALDDPEAIAGFHWPRVEVYTYLGEGEKLIAELEASSKQLPTNYDPPYRLAWLLKNLGKAEQAVAPAKRSLALVYGPRKLRVAWLLAEIHEARQDKVSETAAWAGVIGVIEAFPDDAEKNAPALQKAKERLDKLGG